MVKRSTKRGILCGDFHAGHLVGLTPPSRHARLAKTAPQAHHELERVRQALWAEFAKAVKAHGPFDFCVANGDLIDGRQDRQAGQELITTSIDEQCDMAAEILRFLKAPHVTVTAGTPYHTGKRSDYERQIVRDVDGTRYTSTCEFHSQAWLDVNGCVINARHKPAGGSSVPYGRHTAVAREQIWNLLWHDVGTQPKADVICRSHVHYAKYCGGPDYICMTLPALMGLGSHYGARQCTGLVDWGFAVIEIDARGAYTWQYVIPDAVRQTQQVTLTHL